MNNSTAEIETEAHQNVCANCGIAGVDDIELEECDGCQSVRYCGDKCKEGHREEHEEECKRQAKELHDKELFEQPDETHLGECPLCFLPLPIDRQKSAFYSCCSNTICQGCVIANMMAHKHDRVKAGSCPFCRESVNDKEQYRKRQKERIKANDPAALRQIGATCYEEGDYDEAIKYFTKAADLGDVEAYYQLGLMYWKGEGVEEDEEKMVYHWEKAAIRGHPSARYNLGYYEEDNGNIERSVKHFIISSKLGHDNSMKSLWRLYFAGNITKEDLDATLRTHQAAIDATKSEQREEAYALFLLRQNLR